MKYIILLSLLVLSACSLSVDKSDNLLKDHKVITIDSCEYIMYSQQRGYEGYGYFSHKGNCKNPYHLQTKVTVIDSVKRVIK